MVTSRNFNGLLQQLRDKEISPAYLFTGTEEFLKHKAIAELKRIIIPKAAVNLNYNLFHAKDTLAREIINIAQTLPFNHTSRLIIIKEIDDFKDTDQEILINYLRHPAKATILVLCVSSPQELKVEFFQELSRWVDSVDFPALSFKDAGEYIREMFSAAKKQIDFSGRQMLINRLGLDLEALSLAAEKLILYAGQKKEITTADVETVVKPQIEESVFKITDALSEKNSPQALNVLNQVWQADRTAPELIGLMLGQIRRLSLIKERLAEGVPKYNLCGEFKVSSYRLDKLLKQAERFEDQDFQNNIGLLLIADTEIKTGRIEPRLGIELLLVKMCRGS